MKTMKHILQYSIIAIALAVLGIGCSTTQFTESMLSAAGFKAIPATTPQQQAHLKTLPAGKVTMAIRDGKTYYVYPDKAHQVLYVGQDAQYQEYQKLRLQNQLAEEQITNAELQPDGAWNAWGDFGGDFGASFVR
jgi:hypothetical protein